MRYENYVISLISNTDQILIDTCALMNVEKLEKMLIDIRPHLIAHNKKILVIEDVCLELLRLYEFSIPYKQHLIERVFDIFIRYSDVFIIENANLSEEDIPTAFADCKFLAKLTEEKTLYKQLLITDDRNLAEDAQTINTHKSCNGYFVTPCYINDHGKISEYRFSRTTASRNTRPTSESIKEVEVVKEIPVNAPIPWTYKYLFPATTLCGGFLLGKYGDNIADFLKTSFIKLSNNYRFNSI